MDEKLEGLAQKEFEEMKDQVTQLEDRWLQFKRRLTTAIEDNKRAVRRQREFDQEHMQICSVLETVLQGTQNTGLDQTDMAVDLERVEVFEYCVHLNGFMAVIPCKGLKRVPALISIQFMISFCGLCRCNLYFKHWDLPEIFHSFSFPATGLFWLAL